MQRAGGLSILVADIALHDDAEAHDVEVGVFEGQRIECPFNQVQPARQRLIALLQLQLSAYAPVLVVRQHSQHVGVQIRLPFPNGGKRHRKSHLRAAVERAV